MDRETVGAELAALGLTSYEARAYLSLMGRDSFSAAELAREAAVPRQRVYDVLRSLVEKGLAAERPGGVLKYAATEPSLAVDRLVEVRRQELRSLELCALGVVGQLAPAYTAGRAHTDPLEYIEVLRDPGAIKARFAELQASVEEEILVFTRPPYATPPQHNVAGLEVARRHRARGVYELSLLDDADATEGVRRFMAAGEEARFVPHLPLKLVIIDECIVMFGMEDPIADRSDLTIVVVEHSSLARLLKVAFEATWERGLTLDQAQAQARAREAAEVAAEAEAPIPAEAAEAAARAPTPAEVQAQGRHDARLGAAAGTV